MRQRETGRVRGPVRMRQKVKNGKVEMGLGSVQDAKGNRSRTGLVLQNAMQMP